MLWNCDIPWVVLRDFSVVESMQTKFLLMLQIGKFICAQGYLSNALGPEHRTQEFVTLQLMHNFQKTKQKQVQTWAAGWITRNTFLRTARHYSGKAEHTNVNKMITFPLFMTFFNTSILIKARKGGTDFIKGVTW
jgi:hypothetical protein